MSVFRRAGTTGLLAGREKSNVVVKLLRLKQTETDLETSHIINHAQPMRGESGQNYLYKIFLFFTIFSLLRDFCLGYLRTIGASPNLYTIPIQPQ